MTDDIAVDPDTGEVLWTTPEERAALVATLVEDIAVSREARERGARATRLLSMILGPDDPPVCAGGIAVVCRLVPGRRAVNTQAIEGHREALAGTPLEPRTEEVTRYPGVADVDKHLRVLARLGIPPASLIISAGPPRHEIKVIEV